MMHLIHRPAGSLLELIERLALFASMSLVACCLIVVEGLTAMVDMTLRCAVIVLIGVGAAVFMAGVISTRPWASPEFPRSGVGPALPRIEVDSAPKHRGLPT